MFFFRKWLKINLVLIVASLPISPLGAQNKYEELELINVSQMNNDQNNRFDLSGIVIVDDSYYVVADKGWNNYIYEIGYQQNTWQVINSLSLGLVAPLDLEGLDFCNGNFYLINELGNQVYTLGINGEMRLLSIHYAQKNIDPETWNENAGYEGIAVNCKDSILYLAKERDPRFLLEVDMKYGVIESQFNIPEDESNDFADMKYENGYLYLLERGGSHISKVDANTKALITKVSYNRTSARPGKLYEPTKYGMAEALLLTEDEIWIGIDNNGLKASKTAEDRFGITGNQPSILRFKRPAGF